ncbi:MAG: hypothetical protein U0943_13635, partial [Brevundimonas sp.]|nr:hypothetical protein [Brevundimonas sp.]
MATGGGGYAIAGFLYQLLGTIDFATSVAINEQAVGPEAQDTYTVTIEPPSGGDSIHTIGAAKTTTQFKTRRCRGFSERDVLLEVFPDLFKAAATDPDQAFVLQTNGNARLSPSSDRLAELLRTIPLEDALTQAESEGLQFKAHQSKGRRGPREHFDWLLAKVSPGSETDRDRETLAALIRRFGIEDRIAETQIRSVILKRLRQIAGSHETAHQLFLAMAGRLAILATEDHRTVPVASIFADCGIDTAQLVPTVQFVARLRADFDTTMRQLGYDAAQDSRAEASALLGPLPTALAGPSGVGKTWAMARAATEAERSGATVIWIDRPPNERDRVRTEVTHRVQRARDRTANANPLAMRSILDMAAGPGPSLRVCVCLDRLSSPAIAHDLITDPWWAQNGIELMAAIPAAEPDAVIFDTSVELVSVNRFTLTEVRRFLKQRQIDWSTIPIDILRLLRTPGLARQFAALDAPTFRPSDEYVLIQTAWRREPSGYVQPLRAAKGVLKARLDGMASAILDGSSVVYPWPSDASPSLLEAQTEALERYGFIRWTADCGIQLDTDRTLSWALAEAFSRLIAKGSVSSKTLEPLLQRWWQGKDAVAGLRRHALGYVPLDLLWLLAAEGVTPALLDLVKALTPGRKMLDWDDIATLGGRGAAIAQAYVVSLPPKDWPAFIKPLTNALLAGGMTLDIRKLASRFLRSKRREKRMLALEIYVRHPDSRQLKTLVSQRVAFDAMSNAPGESFNLDHQERTKTYEAAAAAVRRRPSALLKLIQESPPPSHIRTLSWLVSELPPSKALAVWREAASTLSEWAAGHETNQHLLVLADPQTVDRFYGTKMDDDFLFEAQCVIDPDAALARFTCAPLSRRIAWLPYLASLVRLRSDAVQSLVIAELMDGSLSSAEVARGMTGWASLATTALWAALIDRTPLGDERALATIHRTLASTATSAQLMALDSYRDAEFAKRLLETAERHVGEHTGRSADWDLKAASAALLRLGGPAFTRLTLTRLAAESDIERRQGEVDALLCDSPLIGEALAVDLQRQFETDQDKVSQTSLDTLAQAAPARALTLAAAWLETDRPVGIWAAGEIALDLENRELAVKVLSCIGRVEGSVNRRLEIRLLAWFRTDDHRLRKVVAEALKLDASDGRSLALWAAERLADEVMFSQVEEALDHDLARSDFRDARTIAALSHHKSIGPRLLGKLRAKPRGHGLSRILADARIAPSWAKDPLFGEMALDDALQFKNTF